MQNDRERHTKVRKIWANMTSHCWSIIRRYSGCFLVNTREGDYRPIDSIYNSKSSTAGHNLRHPRHPLRFWQLLRIEQHDFLAKQWDLCWFIAVTLSIFYFILRWQVSDWKTENNILYCKVWKIVAASVESDQYSSFLSLFNSTMEMQKIENLDAFFIQRSIFINRLIFFFSCIEEESNMRVNLFLGWNNETQSPLLLTGDDHYSWQRV